MLKTLELTNFRKHQDLVINLTEGINVLRGANEQGKSSVLEAIAYAFYGSRALRSSLSEVVTWGQLESSLRVKLTILAGGHEYVFTRSKNSAQVTKDGEVFVTGQTEVTNFSASLLGADERTASMLMVASQADLRGALDKGPAAVSSLIGKLANFDLIDQILSAAQEKLLQGPEANWVAQVERTKGELGRAILEVPAVNLESMAARVTTLQVQRDTLSAHIAEKLRPAATAAVTALSAAQATNSARQAQVLEIDRVNARRAALEGERVRLQAEAGAGPSDDEIAAAEAAVKAAETVAERRAVLAKVQGLPARTGPVWDDTEETFRAELEQAAVAAQDAALALRGLDAEATAVAARRITSGRCPTCGASTVDDEHVARINAEVDEALAILATKRRTADDAAKHAAGYLLQLKALDRAAAPFVKVSHELDTNPLVAVDRSVFPPTITWIGGEVGDGDVVAARRALGVMVTRRNAAQRATGALEAAQRDLAQLEAQVISLTAALPAEVPTDDLLAQAQAASKTLLDGEAELRQLAVEHQGAVLELQAQQQRVEAAQRAVAAAQERASAAERDLAEVVANNLLIKKLKAIKPAVTNHLWSIVLGAVSAMFTQVRGEASVVTKDDSGFKVNGWSAANFSGSTLDLLALTMRAALTKTFIPHAPFLSLDEPAHGSDTDRTSSILGFLASSGFDQVLLASHDELSESVANNVINLN